MAAKFTKVSTSLEKRILIGFIVSDEFVNKIKNVYNRAYLTNPASKRIAKWCLDYYEKYKTTPKLHIQDIYDSKQATLEDEDVEYIETVLAALSDEWDHAKDKFNFKFLLDECAAWFEVRSLLNLSDDVKQKLDINDLEGARNDLQSYKAPVLSSSVYTDPFGDHDAMRTAIQRRTESLFKLPGYLGKYINSQLYREAFIAFQAPEKAGKSFVLQEIVLRAARNRCNVALFEMGDMSQDDRLCRIGMYVARRPFTREKVEEGTRLKVRIPELLYDSEGKPAVKFIEQEKPILTADEAIKHCKKWERRVGKDRVRISTHASDTINFQDVNNILLAWKEQDGWVPDVIVLDYMDIAAPERAGTDTRTNTNDTWKAGRRLSQEWHALVLSATQADAKSYGKTSQNLKNFSEDKRKYAHITAMYSINQTLQEKTQNTYRIGTLLVREGRSQTNKECAIVHCLDLGRPYMYSYETEVTDFDDDEDDDE